MRPAPAWCLLVAAAAQRSTRACRTATGSSTPASGQHGPGGVGQDGLAQVVGGQQGQVVAPGQAGHPGRLERSWYMPVGSLPPPLGQFLEAGVGLGRAGGQGGHLVQAHVLDGGGLPAVGGGELGPQLGGVGGDLAGALGELGQESLGHAGHLEPGLVEWRRSRSSQPTSRAPVNRSASAPSYSSDSVVTALYRARGVERAPAAVGAAPGPGPDQQVVVQLGVV